MKSPFHLHLSSIAVASTALLVACGTEPTTPADTPPPSFAFAAEGGEARDHLILLNEHRGPTGSLLAAVAAAGGTVERRQDQLGALWVSGLDDDGVAELAGLSEVDGIELDYDVQWIQPLDAIELVEAAPESDQSGAEFYSVQWNIHVTQADDAWGISPQGAGALVCVLDTGVDATHQSLAGKVNLAKSTSVFPAEPFIEDLHFHGTFVSGMVAANGIRMASIAPDAELCMVKIAGVGGFSPFVVMIDGIMHATNVGADVMNISFGGIFPAFVLQNPLFRSLQRAIQFAWDNGTMVVISAGNAGIFFKGHSDLRSVPAQMAPAISVGATAPFLFADFDLLASYTNFGPQGAHLMAPGGDPGRSGFIFDGVISACSQFQQTLPFTCNNTNLIVGAGTSFASPMVAGAVAVIESAVPGNQAPKFLKDCLFKGLDHPDGNLPSDLYTSGRLNIFNSVSIPRCGGFVGKKKHK